jgi:trehalose-phosphatase
MESTGDITVQTAKPSDFWSRVFNARHRLLALDYDGTLAPFHIDPMQAHPLPGIPEILDLLNHSANTTVAIVSGRPVQEVSLLLGEIGLTMVGCHGFESLDPEGSLTVKSPSQDQLDAMDMAVEVAARLGVAGKLEVKTASVALHTRGIPPEEAAEIELAVGREWSRLTPYGVSRRSFNGGVELFCAGWNKADALRELLCSAPPGAFPVYIGDDATDEDAFRFLKNRGVGIKVGSHGPATAAERFLPDCEAVRAFLREWLSLAMRERS